MEYNYGWIASLQKVTITLLTKYRTFLPGASLSAASEALLLMILKFGGQTRTASTRAVSTTLLNSLRDMTLFWMDIIIPVDEAN